MTIKTQAKRAALQRKDRIKFRAGVVKRSMGFCDRCGEWHGDALHAHHYRPRSLGGRDDPRLPEALLPHFKGIPVAYRRSLAHGASAVEGHPDGNGVALCGKCHHDCHMRRGEAARWIDSTNRSLPPAPKGAPLTGTGAAGTFTQGTQP